MRHRRSRRRGEAPPRVVVVGSGFGGLNAATRLARRGARVTVVNRDNYHGFWPLLYQVATAGLGPDDIAYPVRAIYARRPTVTVRRAEVLRVDLERHTVVLEDDEPLTYDYIVLAPGSVPNDFGIPGVAEHAFALKTLSEAFRIRNHVLAVLEAADARRVPPGDPLLTTVIVGGGPTGVELAGALTELVRVNLAADFRQLDLGAARVVLLEAADHLLTGFSPRSQQRARKVLERRGVEVRLGATLAEVDAKRVLLADGTAIPTKTVIWTAGVRASPLLADLPVDHARNGAVRVEKDLSIPGHPEAFVVGDAAAATGAGNVPLPQLAQVAIQGGRHAARSILRRASGEATMPFRYHNHGIMATIGRRAAVAELPGHISLGGTPGWLAWLGVHLVFLMGFRNRAVVFINWAWNYLTWERGSRVLIDEEPLARE